MHRFVIVSVAAGLLASTAPAATAAESSQSRASWNMKNQRCSHKSDPPRDPGEITIGTKTHHMMIKKMRGFGKVRKNKRVCVFQRPRSKARVTLSGTYRVGTRPRMTKRYFKARQKPGFKLIKFSKGSKVKSSEGKRTVLAYTFKKKRKRMHVRVHGDARVVFAVRARQAKWKNTWRAAGKMRRQMRVQTLCAGGCSW